MEQIREYLGADSIGYLNLEGMIRATRQAQESFCLACFTGDYPIPVDPNVDKFIMKETLVEALSALFVDNGLAPPPGAIAESPSEGSAARRAQEALDHYNQAMTLCLNDSALLKLNWMT